MFRACKEVMGAPAENDESKIELLTQFVGNYASTLVCTDQPSHYNPYATDDIR